MCAYTLIAIAQELDIIKQFNLLISKWPMRVRDAGIAIKVQSKNRQQ